MGKAIMINLSDEGGEEVYDVLDRYRFSKRATWKQVVLQALILAMLQDKVKSVDKVIKYATKK